MNKTMKTYNKYIAAFAAVAMALASCSQDDTFAPDASDMVQIASAQIAVEATTRVNSLGAGDVFENGDNILLVNHSRGVHNKGTYTATISGGTAQWNLTDGAVLWAAGSGENQLTAYHPAVEQYVLPADQSTIEQFVAADHMTATAVARRGDVVDLTFDRHMAKVTFVPRLVDGLTTVNSFTIATKDATTVEVTPYSNGSNFTAILTPGTYEAGETVVTMTASNATQQYSFVAKTKTAFTLEAGKAYTLDIQVGKDIVAFNNIRVKPWTDYALGSEDAEQFSYSYDPVTKTLTILHSDLGDQYWQVLEEYYDIAENYIIGGSDRVYIGGEKKVSVTLPDVISMRTSIGCYVTGENITELNLPQVRLLGEGAIWSTGLTEFEIPATVTEIYGNPFVYLYNPGGGSNTYTENPNLNSITVAADNDIFRIEAGNYLYNVSDGKKMLVTDLDAYKSTSVSVPNGTTGIGGYAFKDHYMLTSATISYGVTSIGNYAFYKCSKLTSIIIPGSVKHIGDRAFNGCGLTSLTLSSGLESIGASAFAGCSMATVVIPEGVTSIGDYAFDYCYKLTSVTIPACVTSVGKGAFAETVLLATVNYDGTIEQAKALFVDAELPTGCQVKCSDGTYTQE